jgi:hypothetical protein
MRKEEFSANLSSLIALIWKYQFELVSMRDDLISSERFSQLPGFSTNILRADDVILRCYDGGRFRIIEMRARTTRSICRYCVGLRFTIWLII